MNATVLDPQPGPAPGTGSDAAAVRPRADARLASIDVLRGIVIVLMALDHVRDFFTNARFDPLDLEQTTPALFLTRWVTHFCAPIFVLLAGTSAFLMAQRMPRATLSAFLAKRGLWLIVLEFTVVAFAWTFRVDYAFGLFLQVIWAIGVSMLVLALLVRLPVGAVAAIGLAIVVLHNLLDPIEPADFGRYGPLWNVLHDQGMVPWGFAAYPLIPWIGIMALGYGLGVVFTWDAAPRRRFLVGAGLAALAAFVALRALNGYGDPQPWSPQATPLKTLLGFLDVEKYPPSLSYALVTLGPGLLALAALERARGPIASFFETFGRVPLFAYVVHLVLAHLFAGLVGLALGLGTSILFGLFFTYPPEWGFGLPGVYLAWAVVIGVLYPMCRWFAAVKRRRRDWWLSYL